MINQKVKHVKLVWAVICVLVVLVMVGIFPGGVFARDDTRVIVDPYGREVTIPLKVGTVLSTYPPITTIVYMLAPDTLVGWNFKPDIRNMPEKYHRLPITGGWFGLWSGNYETIIKMHPEVILYGTGCDEARDSDLQIINERQEKFGKIPVIGLINVAHIKVVDEAILFLGRILGAEDKAGALVEFHRRADATVCKRAASLSQEQRVRVYYAEGPKGLLTDPEGSRHAELIGLCGGVNVAVCPIKQGMGQTEVSIEQVLEWNPEVIITENPKFFNSVYKNPLWSQVKAVRDHRVYLTPRGPFCWFDRPPGATTILGLYWTAVKLHPEMFADIDLEGIARDFYREFYHYDLSDGELTELLEPKVGVSPAFLPHRTQ